MRIAVLLSPADPAPDVDPLTGAVRTDPRTQRLHADDEAALEHALRIVEAHGGTVLAAVAGADSGDEDLRMAASLGADVLRIDVADDPLCIREQETARSVAYALTHGRDAPDLLLCGSGSGDGTGSLPAFLAHELHAAQALGLVSLDYASGAFTGQRRLDRGRRERLSIPLPAVCSIEAGETALRRATLPAAIAASRRPIPVATPPPAEPAPVLYAPPRPARPRTRTVPPPTGGALQRMLALTGTADERDPPTVLGPLSPTDAVDAFLAYLDRHGHTPPRTE